MNIELKTRTKVYISFTTLGGCWVSLRKHFIGPSYKIKMTSFLKQSTFIFKIFPANQCTSSCRRLHRNSRNPQFYISLSSLPSSAKQLFLTRLTRTIASRSINCTEAFSFAKQQLCVFNYNLLNTVSNKLNKHSLQTPFLFLKNNSSPRNTTWQLFHPNIMSRWADTDSDSDDEFQTHGDAGMVLQSINPNLIGQVSS